MNVVSFKSWFWLIAGIAWGGINGLFTLVYREPLTGWSQQTHFGFCFFHGALIGLAAFCFLNKKWRVVASILTLLALFFAVPLPSMAGLKLRLENHSSAEIAVGIARSDLLYRRIGLRLLPNTSHIYQTAPGDWAGDAGLLITCGSNQISATIRELRNKKVIFASNGISLVDVTTQDSATDTTTIVVP